MRHRKTFYPLPTYDGPTGRNKDAEAEIEQLRAVEAVHDRVATMEQGLSRRLSHTYGRDVWCSVGVAFGTFEAELPGNRHGIGTRLPPLAFMLHGQFIKMKMAPDVAYQLLQRDERREAA